MSFRVLPPEKDRTHLDDRKRSLSTAHGKEISRVRSCAHTHSHARKSTHTVSLTPLLSHLRLSVGRSRSAYPPDASLHLRHRKVAAGNRQRSTSHLHCRVTWLLPAYATYRARPHSPPRLPFPAGARTITSDCSGLGPAPRSRHRGAFDHLHPDYQSRRPRWRPGFAPALGRRGGVFAPPPAAHRARPPGRGGGPCRWDTCPSSGGGGTRPCSTTSTPRAASTTTAGATLRQPPATATTHTPLNKTS